MRNGNAAREVGQAPAVGRNVTKMAKEGKRAAVGRAEKENKAAQSNVVTARPFRLYSLILDIFI